MMHHLNWFLALFSAFRCAKEVYLELNSLANVTVEDHTLNFK